MSLIPIVQKQLARELDGFIREVEACPDDASLWAVVPGVTNSVGTLALHVSGNLQHFIGKVLGGRHYMRNRELEFSHRGSTRGDVVAELQRARGAVMDALGGLAPARLEEDYPELLGGHTVNTAMFLVHLGAHLAFHLGQAGYVRRVVTGTNVSAAPLPLSAIAR